jgi:hypothetical protein
MITRKDVLVYFESQPVPRGCLDVAAHFGLSRKAAAKHVARMWGDSLVATPNDRPRWRRFRLAPGEQLESIRFRLTERGRKRLSYYRRRDEAGSAAVEQLRRLWKL